MTNGESDPQPRASLRQSAPAWRTAGTTTDWTGTINVLSDGTLEFVGEGDDDCCSLSLSELSISWPSYSLGGAMKVVMAGEDDRHYVFYNPRAGGGIRALNDVKKGRKVGKQMRQAIEAI